MCVDYIAESIQRLEHGRRNLLRAVWVAAVGVIAGVAVAAAWLPAWYGWLPLIFAVGNAAMIVALPVQRYKHGRLIEALRLKAQRLSAPIRYNARWMR